MCHLRISPKYFVCDFRYEDMYRMTITSRCLEAASNGGRSSSSVFPNCPRPQLSASKFSQLQLSTVSTDSTSPCYRAPVWTAQKTSLPKLCCLVAGETCQQNCSLAKAVLLSSVYRGVTWQWVCMSQYLTPRAVMEYKNHGQRQGIK
jgi:hypothetical protein